jgi:hypothetical protein
MGIAAGHSKSLRALLPEGGAIRQRPSLRGLGLQPQQVQLLLPSSDILLYSLISLCQSQSTFPPARPGAGLRSPESSTHASTKAFRVALPLPVRSAEGDTGWNLILGLWVRARLPPEGNGTSRIASEPTAPFPLP